MVLCWDLLINPLAQMEDVIRYRTEASIATITLNRPDKRNALNAALVEGLGDALRTAEEDDAVRCIVITGTGSAFCAGADLESLRRLQDATMEENEADSRRLADLYAQIYLHPKSVIAKINGHALGGGCGLAAVCDFSIASEGAKLGFTEVRIGFVPAIVSVFVLRKLGETAARDLFLRGHLISAGEAADSGLITRAVAARDLDAAVDALAAELATEPSPTAVGLTKRLLAEIPGLELQEALAYAVQLNASARSTIDCKAGITAFLQKTAPPWKRHR